MRGQRRPRRHLHSTAGQRGRQGAHGAWQLDAAETGHPHVGRRKTLQRWEPASARESAVLAIPGIPGSEVHLPDTLHVCDTVVAADGSRTSMPANYG